MPLKSNLKSDSCLAQRGKSALFQNAAEEADIENDHTLASALGNNRQILRIILFTVSLL